MKTSKIILALFIVQILCLFVPQSISCQTESLEIITYTPPKGWTKTAKNGVVVYSDANKTTNAFCLLTIYASTPSAGGPKRDFVNTWNEKVVKPFKGQANPKTETQTDSEGWQVTAGAAEIEIEGGKSYAMLTVYSGYGKTTSILAVLNSDTYIKPISAFLESVKLDKTDGMLKPPPTVNTVVGSSSNSVVGKWAKSFSGTNGRDQSANVLNSEYYKSQYTFNPNGTYLFKAEKWLGYIKSNEFWMTDESGDYTVVGDKLTIIPKKSVSTLKNREGVAIRTQANTLEKTTYKWTLYYFSGIKETDLILQTDPETRRDGPFGNNDLFPKSYLFSQKYVPEWKF
jgi:hypothetical protein